MWYLICGIGEKSSYLQNKKVRKKNQIFEYHTSSSERSIKTIRE